MTADDLPALFAEGWALPKPDAFLGFFVPLIHPEARFARPLLPVAVGRIEIDRMFRRLFRLPPDLTAVPVLHALRANVVFIESECEVVLGGRTVAFSVCDRFAIQDRLIVERRSYLDPLPVALATLRRPRSWARLMQLVS